MSVNSLDFMRLKSIVESAHTRGLQSITLIVNTSLISAFDEMRRKSKWGNPWIREVRYRPQAHSTTVLEITFKQEEDR